MSNKPVMSVDEVKRQIQYSVDKTGFTTYGENGNFKYDPNKPVKCSFHLVLDHTLWSKFCELGEELNTSPSLLLHALMEQAVISTGKLSPGYEKGKSSEPIVVSVADLQEDKEGKFLGLGQNKVLGIPESKTATKRGRKKKEDEIEINDDEEVLEMNFLSELS